MTAPREIAMKLIEATSMLGDPRAEDPLVPTLSQADYYRIACHMLFACRRCGTCCRTGDPIKLREDDVKRIARHLRITPSRAMKRYVARRVSESGKSFLAMKHTRPCRFYDESTTGCSIYEARPWSCRIFPFLGIYGSEDAVKVHTSCPGSIEAVKALTGALSELKESGYSSTDDPDVVRRARRWFDEALLKLSPE